MCPLGSQAADVRGGIVTSPVDGSCEPPGGGSGLGGDNTHVSSHLCSVFQRKRLIWLR